MNPIANSLVALTPRQTLFVKHLNGLAPVATSIVTPMIANYQFRQSGVGDHERKILVFQEVVRQVISSVIGLTTYYGGMLLTGRFFKGSGGQKTLAQIIGGTIMSFIGYGFIRPMVSSEIIARWMGGGSLSASPSFTQSSSLPPNRLQGMTTGAVQSPSQQRFNGFVQDLHARTPR